MCQALGSRDCIAQTMQDQMANVGRDLERIIRSALTTHFVGNARGSESHLVPLLRRALSAEGYDATAKYRLPGPIRLGRDPLTGEFRQPLSWAEADIKVLKNGRLAGVIESEHDLAWVVPRSSASPKSSAAWRYSMSSIALNNTGAIRFV